MRNALISIVVHVSLWNEPDTAQQRRPGGHFLSLLIHIVLPNEAEAL